MKKAIILSAILALVACTKEPFIEVESKSDEGTVTLTATIEEEFTRTYLDSEGYVCWSNGDEVWINGKTYSITVSGNTATIKGVETAGNYACVYPASVVKNPEGSEVNIELPATQTISRDSEGRQKLSLPMAAYGDGSSALEFKNLCGLVAVTVSNTVKSNDFTVNSITLTTKGDGNFIAPLWGTTSKERDLSSTNIANDWAVLASNIGSEDTNAKRTLTVSLSETIATNKSATYLITVPVIDDGTRSKIQVKINASDGDDHLVFDKCTSSEKTIARNCKGSIPEITSFQFSKVITTVDANNPFEGQGTSGDPYLISSKEQFLHMATLLNNETGSMLNPVYSNKYFKQITDIDFDGATIKSIGYYGYYGLTRVSAGLRGGTYDGGGHSISNFQLEGHSDVAGIGDGLTMGVFGYISDGATLKNLNVENKFTPTKQYRSRKFSGFVVGTLDDSTIKNVSCNCDISDNTALVKANDYLSFGGIVGECRGNSVIDGATFKGNLKVLEDYYNNTVAQLNLGGIVGEFTEDNREFNGNSSGYNYEVSDASVKNCRNLAANLTGKAQNLNMGGIVGNVGKDASNVAGYRISFENCTNEAPLTCDVSGASYIGGIVGNFSIYGYQSDSNEDNDTWAYVHHDLKNNGAITCTSTGGDVSVGGLVGYYSPSMGCTLFRKCSNNASVTVTDNAKTITAKVGGMFGELNTESSDINVVDRFSNIGNISATASSSYLGGLLGYTEDYTNGDQVRFQFLNVMNRGDITGTDSTDSCCGGIIGGYLSTVPTGYSSYIMNAICTGGISSSTNAGGIIGRTGYWGDGHPTNIHCITIISLVLVQCNIAVGDSGTIGPIIGMGDDFFNKVEDLKIDSNYCIWKVNGMTGNSELNDNQISAKMNSYSGEDFPTNTSWEVAKRNWVISTNGVLEIDF